MSECASDCMDTVDPRVQVELERLNTSTDDINKLEVDLDEARLIFRQLLFESTFKIQSLAKKLGNCIDKSRPYYEARFKANTALHEMRSAAVLYEKANSAHSAAREMVYLAEQGLCKLCESSQEGSGGGGVPLDPAWQEMLNHATARVNQAESDRTVAGQRHRETAEAHARAQHTARTMQHALKRHVNKSRPYFEEKARYNALLDTQKSRIQRLEKQVGAAKLSYAQALRNLEQISEEIHRHRTKPHPPPDIPATNGQPAKTPNEAKKLTNGVKSNSTDNQATSANDATDHISKTDTIREWIKQNGSINPANDFNEETEEYKKTGNDKLAVIRPKSLPQDFSDKYSDALTPFQARQPLQMAAAPPKNSASTPSTKNGPESDNWIEINLEYSSPEEISFEKCSNFSSLECYRQIPYERMTGEENEEQGKTDDAENQTKTVELEKVKENRIPNSKVSADSPRRIIRNRLAPQKSLKGAQEKPPTEDGKDEKNVKTKGEWLTRGSGKEAEPQFSPTRRQSLDVLLNDTGEKMKEIFNQGIMMFQITSLTERRSSEPRSDKDPPSGKSRRLPSPLDKSLAHLAEPTVSDDQASDTESLASVEMLNEDQINSLMLDSHLQAACQDLLGIPAEAPTQ